jgi:uncharacterized protein
MIQWLKRLLLGTPLPAAPPVVRRCQRCEQPQVLHITTTSRTGQLTEAHLCEVCARAVLSEPFPADRRVVERPAEVWVEVERVIISEVHEQQVISFREVEGERRLSFVLGIFEATTIDRILKAMECPRPLTHDAWLSTVVSLGAVVGAACIHEREGDTYFAELRLHHNGQLVHVDVRPSDALGLTLKAGAPFLIADRLLAEVCDPERR